jgi:hypothetical protein
MSTNKPITKSQLPNRRKFVWNLGILSLLATIASAINYPLKAKTNIIACKPGRKIKMVKMLTQDGRLVEIDETLIKPKRAKISNAELQIWVKNKLSTPTSTSYNEKRK